MNLMSNETVLFESDGKSLILTTHRVRYQFEAMGNAEIRSIMLEELASCAMVRSSNNVLLILAGISLVAGLFLSATGGGNQGAAIVGGLVAVALVIIYLASRRQILALASSGTTISVNTQGMTIEAAKQFIEKTEAAKNARYLLGKGT